jgi:hypothetical protein
VALLQKLSSKAEVVSVCNDLVEAFKGQAYHVELFIKAGLPALLDQFLSVRKPFKKGLRTFLIVFVADLGRRC